MGIKSTIAVIGAGNMGGAIVAGLVKSGVISGNRIKIWEPDKAKAKRLCEECGSKTAKSAHDAIDGADVVILAIKPQTIDKALAEIGDVGNKIVISVVAGVKIEKIRNALGGKAKVVRTMPNTPALIGAGVTALCAGPGVTAKEMDIAEGLMTAVGDTVVVSKEDLLDAVTGLSGSGPAYIYLVIEALADGGVMMGLDRETSRRLAGETVLGAAMLLVESGKHPVELREMVTSPGGTTAAGLAALEDGAVRSAFIKAVKAATERSREMGK